MRKGGWRYPNFSSHPGFVPVDPDKVRFVQERIAGGAAPSSIVPESAQVAAQIALGKASKDTAQRFAGLVNYQPGTKGTMPMGLGYVQAARIGSLVLPEWQSPKEKASYPVTGTEKLVTNDKKVGINGSVDEIDGAITWPTLELGGYGAKVYIDDREREEAAGNMPPGMTIDAWKLDMVQTSTETLKERHQATFVKATGNYASGSHYTTLSGSTQWSHASGVPIDDIAGKRRTVTKASLGDVDLFWLTEDSFTAIRKNPQVIAAVQYTGTRELPGTMISAGTLVALFNMNIAIAGARGATAPGGTVSEFWGQDAGILCTGGGNPMNVRFGITVTKTGWPVVLIDREPNRGLKGSDKVQYADEWGIQSIKNSAGFLWINASTAY